jgi:hypothetical protein
MLNDALVLDYIKDNLGFPFQKLEVDDDKILDYVKKYVIRKFSYWVPDKNKISLDLNSSINKVPSRQNEYFIRDPEGIDIMNIIELIPMQGAYLMSGHPIMGGHGIPSIREWALNVENSMTVRTFSDCDKTWEFIPPNMVRISSLNFKWDRCTVEYERLQPPDFRKIPTDLHVLFLDYALGNIMVMLGRIRKKYSQGNLRTPFGDIPIGDEIFDEGQTKISELEQKMDTLFTPNINVVFG